MEMAVAPKLFMDSAEIEAGESWVEAQRTALASSKMMLAVLTPSYFRSRACLAELETFSLRSSDRSTPWFIPILFSGTISQFPEYVRRYQFVDLSRYMFSGKAFQETTDYLEFQQGVRGLARVLGEALSKTPPLYPNWRVVEPRATNLPLGDSSVALPRLLKE